jgi:hypothetical protein
MSVRNPALLGEKEVSKTPKKRLRAEKHKGNHP